jgi:hypothetical protein
MAAQNGKDRQTPLHYYIYRPPLSAPALIYYIPTNECPYKLNCSQGMFITHGSRLIGEGEGRK